MSLKICLVNPRLEGPYPPLGIAYIVSYLRRYCQQRCEIKIVDGNSCKDELKEILKFDPHIVGFTALSPQIDKAIRLSHRLKKERRDIFQVIGGIHTSAHPEWSLRHGAFDVAVLGEGEETFRELIERFIEGGEIDNIHGIAGIKNGKFYRTANREVIEPLDKIPPPARDLFNMRHYLGQWLLIRGLKGRGVTTIMTSRGCPFRCRFCSSGIVFKQVRYFSPEYVLTELKSIIENYGVKALFFTDDTFLINKDRIRRICELMLQERIQDTLKWEVQGRADLVGWDDLELLRFMKRAGCVQIDYGFESGSDRVLGFLKLGRVTVKDNVRAIEVTKQAGLKVMGTFMLGTIDETESELDHTRKFIENNFDKIDSYQAFITTAYPGTELYEIYKERGDPSMILNERTEAVLKESNRMAIAKISLRDKFEWFIYNLFKQPLKLIRAVKSLY